MKVILNDHVEHLGERGASVEVKPGFARNFLLPKGLAYLDTPGNRRIFEQEQKRWHEMDLKRRSAAEAIQEQMQGLELLFERRAGEKDVLFGSVTTADIGHELEGKGFEIDRRRIAIDGGVIKEIGSFEASVTIHRDVSVTIPIHVVRPGEQPVVESEPAEADAVAAESAEAEPVAAEAETEPVVE